MRIKIENGYSDGHESQRIEEVAEFVYDPTDKDYETEAEALDGYLFTFTGDGHGIGRDEDNAELGYCYEVTVLDADNAALVGYSVEWVGA